MQPNVFVLPLLLVLVVGCSGGGLQVATPIQGPILVGNEREAQRASRALLDRIDEDQAELEKIAEQLQKAVGPTKRAEREDLNKRKQELNAEVRKYLGEFLAYVPRVEQQGWKLQPFDEARYFYYSYQFKELLPAGTPSPS
jgi:hypothetical protein